MTKNNVLKFTGSVLVIAALAFLTVQRFIAISHMDAAFEQEVMSNVSLRLLYFWCALFFVLAALGCYWSWGKIYPKLVSKPNLFKKSVFLGFLYIMWCGFLTVLTIALLYWL